MASIVFTIISILNIFLDNYLSVMQLPRLFPQQKLYASRILLCNWEHHSHTLFSSVCTSVLASILMKNRIELQHIDLIFFPVTTSRKFKFEGVTSNSFYTDHSPFQTSDNHMSHETRINHVKLIILHLQGSSLVLICLAWISISIRSQFILW